MQLLADGGGVYTNTPCPGCQVSRNYFQNDPHVYGCLYHDGGSALWTDVDNVFNHISTSAVFAHGNSPGITVTPLYYNDSEYPSLEGATNHHISDSNGVCVAPSIYKLKAGAQWSGVAADVVRNAGVRSGTLPPLATPALSPPVNKTAENAQLQSCIRFAARKCDAAKQSQRWLLTAAGVKPGDGNPTGVKSAILQNASCWQANNCGFGSRITCDKDYNTNGAHGGSPIPHSDDGCKGLPPSDSTAAPAPGSDPAVAEDSCAHNQAFSFNSNGTIQLAVMHNDRGAYMHHCLQIQPDSTMGTDATGPIIEVGLSDCVASGSGGDGSPPAAPPSQIWTVASNSDGTVTIEQNGLCIDNNYNVNPAPPTLPEFMIPSNREGQIAHERLAADVKVKDN